MSPTHLQIQIGGFFNDRHSIELKEGALHYKWKLADEREGPDGYAHQRVVQLADIDWEDFARALDEGEFWKWAEEYKKDALDGMWWCIEVDWGEHSQVTQGENGFPLDSDLSKSADFDAALSEDCEKFVAVMNAAGALVGGDLLGEE